MSVKKDLQYYLRLSYNLESFPYQDSDGTRYWLAEYTEIVGCKAEGNSRLEAVNNVKDLFEDMIEVLLEENHQIPEPSITNEIQDPLTLWQIQIPIVQIAQTDQNIEISNPTEGNFVRKKPITLDTAIPV